MRALIGNRFALLGVVIAAIAALFAVVWMTRPAPGRAENVTPRIHMASVTSAMRSCPSLSRGRIAIFAAPGQAAGGQMAAQGNAKLISAPATTASATGAMTEKATPALRATPLVTLSQPARLWLSGRGVAAGGAVQPTIHRQTGAVTIEASGGMAQGLDAERTYYPPNGSAASVTGVQCTSPGTDFWFVGPGEARAASIRVHMVNPDSQPAEADVEIFTDTGPLQGNTDTGIPVPPGGSVVQSIGKLVKGSRVLALHVRTSVGRVAASVQAAGIWWRPASPPATRSVIPGLPGAGTGRRLFLIDPGSSDAQVHVKADTPAGSYEPAGAGGIDVPAGSAIAVDLPSLNGIPAALRLDSAVPVTAAMQVGTSAFTAATGPVAQQGVVADNVTGTAYTVSVVISAPVRAAQVRISTAGPGGPAGTGRLVELRAKRSKEVRVTVPRSVRGGFAIVITPAPGSGPVYAGRIIASEAGGVQLITPVVSSPVSVPLPSAGGSVAATLP
ncbi:MAG: DUF5719 family protein [Micromonosporaceae bacterium]